MRPAPQSGLEQTASALVAIVAGCVLCAAQTPDCRDALALSRSSNDAARWLSQAERLSGGGDLPCAAAAYEQALVLQPDSIQARIALGRLLFEMGRPDQAVIHLVVANQQAPRNPETVLLLARAVYQNGEKVRAVELLEPVVDNRAARAELASMLAMLGRYAEAASHFRVLTDSDAGDLGARLALAASLIQSHSTAEGKAELAAYVAGRPEAVASFEVAYLSGLAARQDGDYEAAVQHLRRAVDRDGSHADARYQLGFSLSRTGEWESALPHLLKAKSLDPGSIQTRFQLTMVLQRLGRRAEAESEAAELSHMKQEEQRSRLAASAINRASTAMAAGDAAAAAALYRQALEHDPANVRALYNLALALQAAGDMAGMRRSLEEALSADPKFAPALHQLALADLSEGRVVQAEQRLALAIESEPTMAEALNNLAVVRGQMGRLGEGVELLRRAVMMRPDYAEAHRNLGLLLAQQGKLEDAEKALQRAQELAPSDPRTLQALKLVRTPRPLPNRAR